jgi:hypothetical protein
VHKLLAERDIVVGALVPTNTRRAVQASRVR